MKTNMIRFALAVGLAALGFAADDGLDPKAIAKPPAGTWPTYNGDYSGKRYSPLAQLIKPT